MKKLVTFAILGIALNAVLAFGQHRADLESKYGEPVVAYSVSEKILMSPHFGLDGQVCRMTFYTKRFSSDTIYVSSELPFDEFRTVVDSIIPMAARGSKKEPFAAGGWATGGGARWAIFTYERLTISYVASFKVDSVDFSKQPSFVFSDDAIARAKAEPNVTAEDYSLYRDSTAEVVTVQWNDRQCSGLPKAPAR
jgi:hypothetical protein